MIQNATQMFPYANLAQTVQENLNAENERLYQIGRCRFCCPIIIPTAAERSSHRCRFSFNIIPCSGAFIGVLAGSAFLFTSITTYRYNDEDYSLSNDPFAISAIAFGALMVLSLCAWLRTDDNQHVYPLLPLDAYRNGRKKQNEIKAIQDLINGPLRVEANPTEAAYKLLSRLEEGQAVTAAATLDLKDRYVLHHHCKTGNKDISKILKSNQHLLNFIDSPSDFYYDFQSLIKSNPFFQSEEFLQIIRNNLREDDPNLTSKRAFIDALLTPKITLPNRIYKFKIQEVCHEFTDKQMEKSTFLHGYINYNIQEDQIIDIEIPETITPVAVRIIIDYLVSDKLPLFLADEEIQVAIEYFGITSLQIEILKAQVSPQSNMNEKHIDWINRVDHNEAVSVLVNLIQQIVVQKLDCKPYLQFIKNHKDSRFQLLFDRIDKIMGTSGSIIYASSIACAYEYPLIFLRFSIEVEFMKNLNKYLPSYGDDYHLKEFLNKELSAISIDNENFKTLLDWAKRNYHDVLKKKIDIFLFNNPHLQANPV